MLALEKVFREVHVLQISFLLFYHKTASFLYNRKIAIVIYNGQKCFILKKIISPLITSPSLHGALHDIVFPVALSANIPNIAFSMSAFKFTQYTNSLAKNLIFLNAHVVAVQLQQFLTLQYKRYNYSSAFHAKPSNIASCHLIGKHACILYFISFFV